MLMPAWFLSLTGIDLAFRHRTLYVRRNGLVKMELRLPRWGLGMLLGILSTVSIPSLKCSAQDNVPRPVKIRVVPVYPEMARKMAISGTVKLEVVVSPNGTVKSSRVVGGHPLLVNAAVDAVKKWKFEPASSESTGTLEFKFAPEY
jgi:TonB family protein